MRTAGLSLVLAVPLILGCGHQDPCAEDPASCNLGTCSGQCAPPAPGFAEDMVLLWSGPVGSPVPACPSVTPYGTPGYLDTPPAVTCPACSCGLSLGDCGEPPVTANDVSCSAADGGAPLDFPATWIGACNALSPAPTADSVTVGSVPISLVFESQCAAPSTPATTISGGVTQVLACYNLPPLPDGQCPLATNDVCAYAKVEGFSVCLVGQGDIACPSGWNDRHLYYDDFGACTCSCGSPVGDSCSTTVTAYADAACTTSLGSVKVSSDEPPACFSVTLPGSTLGSVAATPLVYTAGTCAPTLTKSPVSTLCCLP